MGSNATGLRKTALILLSYLLGISRGVLLTFEHVQQAVAPASNFSIAHVHTHHIRGGERAAYVPLGLGDDYVHFWREHTAESHRHTETHGEGRGDDLVVGAKVNRHKGQPDNTGSVHGEGDVLGLVEVGRDVAGFKRIIGAAENEQPIVAQWCHHAQITGIAYQKYFSNTGVGFDRLRRLQDNQRDLQSQLHTDEDERDHHLRPRAHEARLARAYLLFAAGQNASDAVGLGDESRVAHGSGESDEEALQVTRGQGGTGDERERANVTQEDASQDDVTEFTAGGLDDWRVSVQYEDEGDKTGHQDAQA